MLEVEIFYKAWDEAFFYATLAFMVYIFLLFLYTESLRTGVFVIFSTFIVTVCLVGTMSALEIGLNQITAFISVVSIGMCNSFTTQVGNRFYRIERVSMILSGVETRKLHANKTISQVGSEFLHGFIFITIAIISLSLSTSFLVSIFIKLACVATFINFLNGTLLIPTLLSYCGPLPRFTNPNQAPQNPNVAQPV